MRVAVIGSGGREHALGWKLAQSPLVREVIGIPGNPGWADVGPTWTDVNISDHAAVVARCQKQAVDLVVIGPEAPLVAGLADDLRAAGIAVVGPGAAGARLEGSKDYAKQFMRRHGIPTAAAASFNDAAAARDYVRGHRAPIVIKADGLAAGKGVVVAATVEEALAAVDHMLAAHSLGAAGSRVLIEQFLDGEEVSVLALVDGNTIVPLLPSQDHKRIGEGDQGPNTGGMGAYTPTSVVDDVVWQRIRSQVLEPSLQGLQADGIDFRGVLYCGLMLVDGNPYVLEYNVRFGDPECQPLMLHLASDLVPLLLATANGTLAAAPAPTWRTGASLCVVMAAAGYPGTPQTGAPIPGLNVPLPPETVVFHAGTARREDGRVVVAGGRVLGVTAHGEDLAAARARAYAAVDTLRWPGVQVRRDIGWRELARHNDA